MLLLGMISTCHIKKYLDLHETDLHLPFQNPIGFRFFGVLDEKSYEK
jgi:hypothetical protein